jgi:nitrite reductase (NO-forming)
MRRVGVFALVLAGLAGLTLAFYGERGGASSTSAEAVTRVTVKATEFKFTLSKRTVPTGIVIFTVVNKGKIAHDFKIANKRTAVIRPGKSATLRVTFKKKGQYRYLCTLPGHAAAGMKGVLAVGLKPPPPPRTTTTAAIGAPIPGAPTTTITVSMTEFHFTLSSESAKAGTNVTFVITNAGHTVHNFDLVTVHAGKIIDPNQSESWTVGFPNARPFTYVCDVPYHAQSGMEGTFTVTP